MREILQVLPLVQIMEFIRSYLQLCYFFYLAVNKQITAKTQNIFHLIAENSYFIKYSLNKLD